MLGTILHISSVFEHCLIQIQKWSLAQINSIKFILSKCFILKDKIR